MASNWRSSPLGSYFILRPINGTRIIRKPLCVGLPRFVCLPARNHYGKGRQLNEIQKNTFNSKDCHSRTKARLTGRAGISWVGIRIVPGDCRSRSVPRGRDRNSLAIKRKINKPTFNSERSAGVAWVGTRILEKDYFTSITVPVFTCVSLPVEWAV